MYDTVDQRAQKALRSIAIAIKPLSKGNSQSEALLEKDLTFIGLYGLIDPPRKEVKKAISECRNAGIKSIMITGDHAKTAEAIAKQINLLPKNGLIVEGYELNQMSPDELSQKIDDIYVFARVTPEHKLKIVKIGRASCRERVKNEEREEYI